MSVPAVPSPATKWVSSGTSRQISGPGALVVGLRVGRVAVLEREPPLGVLGGHRLGPAHGAVGALAAGAVDDLGAPRLEQLPALDRHVVGQHDLEVVAAGLGDHRQRDAGVARARLEDHLAGARREGAVLLRLEDHPLGRPVLHRAAGVLALELGEDAHLRVGRQRRDVDDRRVADEVERGFVDGHGCSGKSTGSVGILPVAERDRLPR